MEDREPAQLIGALFLAFGQACINLKFFLEEEIHVFLKEIEAETWYPIGNYVKVQNTVAERYSNPAPIFEKLGVEQMNIWYELGPGKQIIKRGTDFLRFQTSSEGYYSVIRGNPDQIGEFSLVSLDEKEGTAVVRSTTPLNRDVERGVLKGGLGLTKDLLYVDVDNSNDENIFLIEFH